MTIDHRTIAQQWTEIILDAVLDDIDDIEAIKRATPVVQDLIDSVRKTKKEKKCLFCNKREQYSSDGRCIVCNYNKMLGIK